MTERDLGELVRAVVRAELRAVGLRPPTPAGLGAWRWDADAWCAVGEPEHSPSGGIPGHGPPDPDRS
jgi:hypothetical protein